MALKGAINGFLTRQYEGARGARGNQRLVIGPWTHSGYSSREQGEITFPPSSVLDQNELFERWIDYWLKGEDTGIMDTDPVFYYVMGDARDYEARATSGGTRQPGRRLRCPRPPTTCTRRVSSRPMRPPGEFFFLLSLRPPKIPFLRGAAQISISP